MSAPEPPQIACRRLEGQTAIVSGASSGLGRGIAQRLAAEGAAVVCGDLQRTPRAGRPLDGDRATDAVITAAGGRATFVEWDIRDPGQGARVFALAGERYGRLDIVVANAGISLHEGGSLPDESEESWSEHLEVNLTGTWHTVKLALKALIDQGQGGRIVTIASTGGLFAVPGVPSGYGATKAGVIQLTRQAAIAGAAHDVTVNCVCPGMTGAGLSSVLFEMPDVLARVAAGHPLRRLGTASDIAAAVAFFASPDASWITGVALPVDGGRTCMSSLGDLGLN
jgi:NAD(P)-dependent dehydrogenase (short-subunit alcohol dehydrogenase family)